MLGTGDVWWYLLLSIKGYSASYFEDLFDWSPIWGALFAIKKLVVFSIWS